MALESHWNVKDKAWVHARQASWLDIKQRLEASWRYNKTVLNILEAYYLKGKVPKWDKTCEYERDPIPLIYRLWFDPDHSKENWGAIRSEVLAYPNWHAIEASLQESYDVLWGQGDNHVKYSGCSGAPSGFMGGLEKAMADFLIGPPDCEDYFFYSGGKISKGLDFRRSYYSDMEGWLNLKYLQNPYKLCQHLIEHWYQRLSDEKVLVIQSEEDGIKYLSKYLKAVADYPQPEEGGKNFVRQDYCRQVRDILNSRPLPELIQQLWAKTKA